MERDETGARKVDPYHLLFRGGQFYLLGHSHERQDIRVFRLSRIRGKVAYATKAEHDFKRDAAFDPRAYASRAEWQFGDEAGVAEVWVSERIAWQVERHFGRYGEVRPAADGEAPGDIVIATPYASPRQLVSWVLGLGEHARIVGPPELVAEAEERIALIERRHDGEPDLADPARATANGRLRPGEMAEEAPRAAAAATPRSARSASRAW